MHGTACQAHNKSFWLLIAVAEHLTMSSKRGKELYGAIKEKLGYARRACTQLTLRACPASTPAHSSSTALNNACCSPFEAAYWTASKQQSVIALVRYQSILHYTLLHSCQRS